MFIDLISFVVQIPKMSGVDKWLIILILRYHVWCGEKIMSTYDVVYLFCNVSSHPTSNHHLNPPMII